MTIELILTACIAVTTLVTAITSYRLSTSDAAGDKARSKRIRVAFYMELLITLLLTVLLYIVSDEQKKADKKEAEEFISKKIESLNHVLDSVGIRFTSTYKVVITDTVKLQRFYLTQATRAINVEPPTYIPPQVSPDSVVSYPEELIEEELPAAECRTHGINMNNCFGRFKLINKFTEPILLYEVSNGFVRKECSILISPGGMNLTPLIRAGYHNNDKCEPGAEEHKFYFRTTSSTEIKYGAISFSAHACKIQTKVISPRNFYLAPEGEKTRN